MNNLKAGVHQINTITGDINNNLEKIKKCILKDNKENTDISIFPETSITGYMCGSLWDRFDFVNKQKEAPIHIQNFIKNINYKGVVILGFVDVIGIKGNGFPHLKNAAAIISKDNIYIYHKQLLASADHHEDKKYFDRGTETRIFPVNLPNVGKINIGVLICEDAWNIDHERNIPSEMVKYHGADILVHINQSYFYYGKMKKRYDLLKNISLELNVPIISINSAGVGDILKNIVIFDGSSMIFNKGKLIWLGKRFEEQSDIINFNNKNIEIFIERYNKYKEITEALIFEQKEFFKLMKIPKAQVHISGGLDSSIVAALVLKAMNVENCVFITNPSILNTTSYDYAIKLCDNLNIKLWENPIQSIVDELLRVHKISFNNAELSKTGQASVHAVLRTVQGLAASHQFGSGIVATQNHTEIVLGWSSFHDIGSIGVHSLIGDLTKVELFQLAKYINDELYEKEVIPKDLYNGKFMPAAELPDAMEDPINYYMQSGICALLIRERSNKEELMSAFNVSLNERKNSKLFTKDLFPEWLFFWSHTLEQFEKEVDFAINKMKTSVYKAAQGAPIVIISPRSRGFSNRETLINYF